jgi:hypothetical protein
MLIRYQLVLQLIFMSSKQDQLLSEESLRTYIRSIIPIVIQLKRSASPVRFVEVTEVYFEAIQTQQVNL